jgi:hypothetical protein
VGGSYRGLPALHEFVITFCDSTYAALYRPESVDDAVHVLAIRRQEEARYRRPNDEIAKACIDVSHHDAAALMADHRMTQTKAVRGLPVEGPTDAGGPSRDGIRGTHRAMGK